jgi:hypothetical protein
LHSDRPEAGELAVDLLMDALISFHRLTDGVYADRSNQAEARYIAQCVREMLRRETGLSLGWSPSEAQQSVIERALEALAEEDIDFAARLEREYVREDDDQFNGLFVKNLENVQGDERDVIILSICYAPGSNGKMLMNFGPINQRGGEKRLNVIFSRAGIAWRWCRPLPLKPSPMSTTTVRLPYVLSCSSHKPARLAASSTPNPSWAASTRARDAFAQKAGVDSVRDAMVAVLRARGHTVNINVGRSQFRCDLAIAAPEAGATAYELGILLDSPAQTAADVLERYVFRPGVLRSFGWKV